MNRREFLAAGGAAAGAGAGSAKDLRRFAAVPSSACDGAACDGVELIRDWTGPFCRARARQSRPRRRADQGSRARSTSSCVASGDRAVRRRLPDAVADRRHARRRRSTSASTPTRSTIASRRRRRARLLRSAHAHAAGRRHTLSRVHVVRAIQRTVRDRPRDAAAQRSRCGPSSTPKGSRSRRGETWHLEELPGRRPAPIVRACSRDVADRLAIAPSAAAGRERRRPAGARGTASARASRRSRCCDNLDVIAKQHARAASTFRSTTAIRARWATGSTPARRSAATCARCSSEIRRRGFEPAIWVAPFVAEEKSNVFQQHPRLVHQGRRRRAAAIRSRHVRRLASRAVVRARRHASRRRSSISSSVFRTMRERMGLHLLQARRELLGRDARRTVPRPARDTRRGLPPRHAGDPSAAPATRSSSAAIIRSGRRSALIHGSRSSNDIKRTWDRIATTARQNLQSQLAERAVCGGTIPTPSCWPAI